jgi:hypothetical protein
MALNSFPGVAETTSVNNRVYRATASGTYTVDVKPGVYRVTRQATTNIILGGNTITPSTTPSMVFISTATTSITFNSTVSENLVPWASAPAFGAPDGAAIGDLYRSSFINGEFVAWPRNVAGRWHISTDGRSWNQMRQDTLAATFAEIVKGPDHYVTGLRGSNASGNGVNAWSTNARQWATVSVNNFAYTSYAAAFGNGIYVLGGHTGTNTGLIMWTTNPTTTYTGVFVLLTGEIVTSGAFGNGLFVFGGSIGSVRTSTDGQTWTARSPLFGTNYIYRIVFANGRFMAGGANGTLRTSTDGITWETRNPGFSTAFNLGNIVYDPDEGGVWIVGDGSYTEFRISTDTVTWSVRSTPTAYNQFSMSYGNGVVFYSQYVDNTTFRPYTTNTVITTQSTVPFTDTFIMLDFKGQIQTLA